MAFLAFMLSGPAWAGVVAIDNFPHGVADIERAIEYYEGVLGLKLLATIPPRTEGKLGPNVYDRELQALMDIGGAYYRIATLEIPGAAQRLQLFELVNNQEIFGLRSERQSAAVPTERGALALRLAVRDPDEVARKVAAAYAGDVLSVGGQPTGGKRQLLTVRDEDGFLIHLEGGADAGPRPHPSAAGVVLTAANADEKIRFYRDVLGFELETGEWETDVASMGAAGAGGGRVRRTTGFVPGTNVPFEIVEYDGIDQRRFYATAMGQAGVGWIQLVVRDLDALMQAFVEQRVLIVSTGLKTIDFADSRRVAIRDPDGVFIELVERRTSAAAATDADLPELARHGDAAVAPLRVETTDAVKDAVVDAREGDGMTALHWAVYNDDERAVALLLAAGADPNAATRFGVTPLALAAENRNANVTRSLLERGANVDNDVAGETALHVAARTSAVDVAELLIAHGADPNARDSWQSVTPLMVAAAEMHAEVIRLLIAAGADPNAAAAETELFIGPGDESTTYTQIPRGGMTALMFAAREGCVECVRILAEAGADVNYRDPARVTPLNLAVYNGRFDVARLLLDEGADPSDGSLYLAVDLRNLVADGVNPDHRPVPRPFDDRASLELVQHLLRRGAHPDHELLKELQSRYLGFDRPRYLSGLTPLQRAAEQADVAAMRVLLEGGADPDLQTRVRIGGIGPPTAGGETPLHYAVRSVGGVRSNPLGNRPGALAYRAREPGDSLEAVKLLVVAGANIDGPDWHGDTPLHVAATLGAHDIVALLAAEGAALDARNGGGQTALDAVMQQVESRSRPGPPPGFPFGPANPHPDETAALLRRLSGSSAEAQ